MIKLLIAEDHVIVRKGLIQIMNDYDDIDVAGEATDGFEAIKMIRDEDWDVILMDMSMPGKTALEVMKQTKADKPNNRFIILSMYPEDQVAIRAIKLGAMSYLTKGCDPDQLISAIRAAAQGKRYITPSLANKMAETLDDRCDLPPHERLTDREYEIFLMLISDKKGIDIANQLSLSTKTISAHRANILSKMAIKSNAELIYYAMKNGLITQP